MQMHDKGHPDTLKSYVERLLPLMAMRAVWATSKVIGSGGDAQLASCAHNTLDVHFVAIVKPPPGESLSLRSSVLRPACT